MHKYPQNQSHVGSSGQTLTTNVSMTLCHWHIRHQTHVLCGHTTFGTELNQVPHWYGPYARSSLDKGVAKTRGGAGGGVAERLASRHAENSSAKQRISIGHTVTGVAGVGFWMTQAVLQVQSMRLPLLEAVSSSSPTALPPPQ